MMRLAAVAALAVFGVSVHGQDSDTTTYFVGHHPKLINITIESHADVETIVGTTQEAPGEMAVNLQKGAGSVSLTVPVASLRTGIDARDEHLRSPMWLDAEKFPDISFVSKKSAPVKGRKDQVEVTGDFSVHGQKKEIAIIVDWKEIPAAVAEKTLGPGQWVKFSTGFDVKLSDYGVKIPDGIIAKVSDTWKVKAVIFAGTAKPEKK